MNVNQIENHFDTLSTSSVLPGGELHFTHEDVKNDPAAVLAKVCAVYRKFIRPALMILAVLPFIGKSVKSKIAPAEQLLDAVCPGE